MSRLLPSIPDLSGAEEPAPRVVGVDSDEADTMIAALSSTTARNLLKTLHEEPLPASKLADRVDTSLQNARYHLERLEDAELVEVVDTIYSEKGREMKIYAPANRPLVVFAGGEEEETSLRTALTRLFGALGILGIISVIVQIVAKPGGLSFAGATGGGADGGGPGIMSEAPTTAAEGAAAGLPPGLLFFAGGALVLTATFAIWYLRYR